MSPPPTAAHPPQGTAAPPQGSWAGDLFRFWNATTSRRVHLFILLSCLWLAMFGNQWLRVAKHIDGGHRALGSQAETLYIPPTPVLRMASLGHQSLAADLLYVRVAHYFVDHLIGDSQLPWIDLYLAAIWGLDAHNKSTYRWGAQVIKFGQRIDGPVSERANGFCRLGLEYFPNDPWLYHEIAFNLSYHIVDVDKATRAANQKLALQYLKLAYAMPGFGYDPNYLAHQYARAGRIDESVQLALSSYADATAEQRMQLRIRLEERNKTEAAEQLAWLDRMYLRDWSHAPETLARMLGPKRAAVPPLSPERPENWRPEVATPDPVWEKVATRTVEAPPTMLDPAGVTIDPDEYQPVDGTAAMATATGVQESQP